jgi:hypothetical protein
VGLSLLNGTEFGVEGLDVLLGGGDFFLDSQPVLEEL